MRTSSSLVPGAAPLVLTLLLALAAPLAAGCGGSGGGGSSDDPSIEPGDLDPAAFREAIQGRWVRACARVDAFRAEALVITGAAGSQTIDFAFGAGCAAPFQRQVRTFTYALGEARSASPETWEIDVTIASITLEPLTEAQAEALSSEDGGQGLCGITDWAAGRAEEISGLTCGGNPVPAAGAAVYDVFALEDGKLLSGRTDEAGGLAVEPDDRPVALDRGRPFLPG